MKIFYYLKTCTTCQRIKSELANPESFTFRDIKAEPLTRDEVDRLAKKAGSYEAIFSKRAQKYREHRLNDQRLTEADYRKYLLEDYTFLKRPVLETTKNLIAGNSSKQVEAMKKLG